jgi:hypothetical protein
MKAFKLICAALSVLAFVATHSLGQTAQLTSDRVALAAEGGTVRLLASLTYADKPGAVGWEIALPTGWSLEKIAGGTPPQITPARGTTGTLEFAFTEVPDSATNFEVTVRYPAEAKAAEIASVAYVRARGEQTTVRAATLRIAAAK